jgi:hypothetical protein
MCVSLYLDAYMGVCIPHLNGSGRERLEHTGIDVFSEYIRVIADLSIWNLDPSGGDDKIDEVILKCKYMTNLTRTKEQFERTIRLGMYPEILK